MTTVPSSPSRSVPKIPVRKASAKPSPIKLDRYEGNPVLGPDTDSAWSSSVTTNPAAWIDEKSGDVMMLYRAAGHDLEHRVHLGLARSKDGFRFERESDEPVFSPSIDGFDAGCVEDPRVVKIGEWFYVTYAVRAQPPGHYWIEPEEDRPWVGQRFPSEFPRCLRQNTTVTGLAMTRDFKTFIRAGRLTDPMVDDRDVILFPETIDGRFYMLHRPMEWHGPGFGTDFPTIWISSGKDLFDMGRAQVLIRQKYDWETKIGGNTPPIRTEHGWLTLYHAVGADKRYRLGALLLDLQDPTRVLHRTPNWLMQPEEDYEIDGYYPGVVFPCGKVIKDGRLLVYYGGADKHVAVAGCDLQELLNYLLSCPD